MGVAHTSISMKCGDKARQVRCGDTMLMILVCCSKKKKVVETFFTTDLMKLKKKGY